MDVNTTAMAAGRTYPAATPTNTTATTNAVAGTTSTAERVAERPRNIERAATVDSANLARANQNATELRGIATAYAPRLSELGARVQMDDDLTDSMLVDAFDDVNRVLEGSNFSLSYSIHEGTGRISVRVLDNTGELIREIPPESRLDIYARITEFTGLLFDRNS